MSFTTLVFNVTCVGLVPHINDPPPPLITPLTVVVTLPLPTLLPKYNGVVPPIIFPLINKLFKSVFIRTGVTPNNVILPAYSFTPLILLSDPTVPTPKPFNVNALLTTIPPCNCNVAPFATVTALVPNDTPFLIFNTLLVATLVAPL